MCGGTSGARPGDDPVIDVMSRGCRAGYLGFMARAHLGESADLFVGIARRRADVRERILATLGDGRPRGRRALMAQAGIPLDEATTVLLVLHELTNAGRVLRGGALYALPASAA